MKYHITSYTYAGDYKPFPRGCLELELEYFVRGAMAMKRRGQQDIATPAGHRCDQSLVVGIRPIPALPNGCGHRLGGHLLGMQDREWPTKRSRLASCWHLGSRDSGPPYQGQAHGAGHA
jgi:hypothetical protein